MPRGSLVILRHNFTLWSDRDDRTIEFMNRLHGELAKIVYCMDSFSTRWSSTGTILIVEDDAIARNCAVFVVEGAGYSVVIATGAQEALDALTEHTPIGALFINADMPAMDGFKLAAAALRLHPDLGILIASNRARPRQEHWPEHAVFVSRPYAVPTLTVALASLLAEAGNVRPGVL